MWKVYKHTFPNNKIYIGITKQSVNYRWRKNGTGYSSQPLIYNAILKYGWNNIKHEILYNNLSQEEAEKKEIELILKYKSNKRAYGYNIANGGNCNGTCSKETKIKISKKLKGKVPYNKGKKLTSEHINNIIKAQSKEVICITNNKIYSSVKLAAKELELDSSAISRCCNKKYNNTHGYKFMYLKDYNKNGINLKSCDLGKKIICLENKKIYKNSWEVSKDLNLNRKSVINVCSGNYKTLHGYHFMYFVG